MKTVINNAAFIIKFAYPLPVNPDGTPVMMPTLYDMHTGEPIDKNKKRRLIPKVRESKCFIRVGVNNDPEKMLDDVVIETTSRTHSRDSFMRAHGRLRTFIMALDKMFGDTELCDKYSLVESVHRRQFMKDFNEQCSSTFRKVSLKVLSNKK